MVKKTLSTSELKAHCAQVIDDVVKTRRPVIITKHGKPVARLVPLEEERASLFGFARGTVKVLGDIVEPVDVAWEAEG